ncbi:hypothetical protein BEWA_032110 [Theileria equi strain WA]|uniref:DNA damage-binding protein 1 n=1 Tax=Theileria equi strain WA TaxID=1537102 RepID=L0AYN6_THEEQ|nr:hypothetical protein BEWA_032110 [Theileria equi strain WA]AFZ80358.1 hypothetical protein BEWA_032110 [Theileria equi strain WA]|eukprot:XP_004830024.1 hypothetical protein BEWA_032110 [Theileria equi strain WA]
MYSYCVTAAPSGATINAIKCKLVKNSETEYLVCLKRHSIDVYSIKSTVSSSETTNVSDSRPVLTATLKANSTFVAFLEYRPPNSNQSCILVLTSNYILKLLAYDDENAKFVSKTVASLQEPACNKIQSSVLLKVDRGYNVIIFYGLRRIIKCIVLNKADYFDFSDVITLRTNDSILLDIEFIDTDFKPQPQSLSDEYMDHAKSSSQQQQVGTPDSKRRGNTPKKMFLECKIIVLGQNRNTDSVRPARWLYGMQLFFEIEETVNYRIFNSYGHVPMFGEPMYLENPYNKFLPLHLNETAKSTDSVLLLGAGSVGFFAFNDPKSIKDFVSDFSMSEITGYCQIEHSKFVLSDDNGNIHLMELVLSSKPANTGLKRRIRPINSNNNCDMHAHRGRTIATISDVIITRLYNCDIPSSIINIGNNTIFSTSKVGNTCTFRIDFGNKPSICSDSFKIEEFNVYKTWNQTNLGPIADFTYGEENSHGNKSVLACCGMGSAGKFCSITLGVGIDTICSNTILGISNLFSVSSGGSKTDSNESILCCSFYRNTQFYSVNFVSMNNTQGNINSSLLDINEPNVGYVNKMVMDGSTFREDERTILLSNIDKDKIVQITTSSIIILSSNPKLNRIAYKTVEEIMTEIDEGSEERNRIVHACLCGSYIFIILSNHWAAILDGKKLEMVNVEPLSINISSVAYISHVKNSAEFLALSTWEKSSILILSFPNLDIVRRIKIECTFGIYIKSMKFGATNNNLFFFVSLSDGQLMVYKVQMSRNITNAVSKGKSDVFKNDVEIDFILDSTMHLSNTCTKLEFLNLSNNYIHEQTCNLDCNNIIAIGKQSTAIFSKRDKVEFAKVNISHVSCLCTIPTQRTSSEFNSVLIAYYSYPSLVIGKLDPIEQFHVQNIISGRTFDKVCYHVPSKVAVVGCPPELSATTSDSVPGLNDIDDNNPPFMCLDGSESEKVNSLKLPALALFINVSSKEVIYNLNLPREHLVSSLHTMSFDGTNEVILIGTSKVDESHDAPTEGFLYIVDISSHSEDRLVMTIQRTTKPFAGGVVEITSCGQNPVIAVNNVVLALSLCSNIGVRNEKDRYDLEYLYACDDIIDSRQCLVVEAKYTSNTYVVSLDSCENNIIVGDLMTSAKLLRFKDNCFYELCRDFNSIWCTAVASIDKNTSIVSDDSGNFSIFSKNETPTNDAQSAKFQVMGLFHHGEIINKIVEHVSKECKYERKKSLIKLGGVASSCKRNFCCLSTADTCPMDPTNGSKSTNIHKDAAPTRYRFDKTYLCATSSGSILKMSTFKDMDAFLRLALLEEAIIGIQSDAGNIPNSKWRNFQNSHTNIQTRGFIDGDTVESFLHLPMDLKRRVLEKLQESSKDIQGDFDSIETLTLEIEQIQRVR